MATTEKIVEEPRDVRRREIRVDDEPRLLAHALCGANVLLDRVACVRRAPALPHDRAIDRRALRTAVPP
jgi:hypothetical protein